MTIYDFRIFFTVNNVPALRFPRFALSMLLGVIIVRMDFNGQMMFGVQYFRQQRKPVPFRSAE